MVSGTCGYVNLPSPTGHFAVSHESFTEFAFTPIDAMDIPADLTLEKDDLLLVFEFLTPVRGRYILTL
jgi:hypothetical protein